YTLIFFYLSTFASSCDLPSFATNTSSSSIPSFPSGDNLSQLFKIFCFTRFFHYRERSLLVAITDLQYFGRMLGLIVTLLFILVNPHKKLAPISFDPKKFPFLFKTTQL
ncbi:hypothetical protein MTR_6g082710, partial [Medicago truncatula]